MNIQRTTFILVSGPTGAGKTALAQYLCKNGSGERLATSSVIVECYPGTTNTRKELQNAGNRLDRESEFAWVAKAAVALSLKSRTMLLVVDAVRKPQQVMVFRSMSLGEILHIHLTASQDVLERRHVTRGKAIDSGLSRVNIQLDDSERYHEELREIADIRYSTDIDTAECLGRKILALLNA